MQNVFNASYYLSNIKHVILQLKYALLFLSLCTLQVLYLICSNNWQRTLTFQNLLECGLWGAYLRACVT